MGKLLGGWLAFPAVTVKFPYGWLSALMSGGLVDWWSGGLVAGGGAYLVSQHILPGTRQNPDENPNQL